MSQEILGIFTLTLQNYSSLIWNSNYQGYLIFLLLRVLAKSGNATHEIDSRKYQVFVISSTVQTESINIQLAELHLGHFFGKWRAGWQGGKPAGGLWLQSPLRRGRVGSNSMAGSCVGISLWSFPYNYLVIYLIPILWHTLGLMGATDVMASKAMALTLKAHDLGRKIHIWQTITLIYYSYIILYIMQLSLCNVFLRVSGYFPSAKRMARSPMKLMSVDVFLSLFVIITFPVETFLDIFSLDGFSSTRSGGLWFVGGGVV